MPMDQSVIKIQSDWCNRGNPSADYPSAENTKVMIANFTSYILATCNTTKKSYCVFFTSGATESNSTIIRAVVASWWETHNAPPVIICGESEHKAVLLVCEQLHSQKMCIFVKVPVNLDSTINTQALIAALEKNRGKTALVCIMSMNNETGAINDLEKIFAICAKYRVPLHSDAVQSFGKFPPDLSLVPISSLCASFHKYGGPPGCGLLIINKEFLDGYKLCPLICGPQNSGFRGGTENVPGIAASFAAMKLHWDGRFAKNARIAKLRARFLLRLRTYAPLFYYAIVGNNYVAPCFVIMGGDGASQSPNTILLSYIPKKGTTVKMCNGKLKKCLQAHGYIISIGSACNTKSKYASHVLTAIGADDRIRAGTIRISFGDQNIADDMDVFVDTFVKCCVDVRNQQ